MLDFSSIMRIRPPGSVSLLVASAVSREAAARVGGMDRQTVRDWVIRFNEQGPEGLINTTSPGAPAKLNAERKAFLARIVDEDPTPAIHEVVRWRPAT